MKQSRVHRITYLGHVRSVGTGTNYLAGRSEIWPGLAECTTEVYTPRVPDNALETTPFTLLNTNSSPETIARTLLKRDTVGKSELTDFTTPLVCSEWR